MRLSCASSNDSDFSSSSHFVFFFRFGVKVNLTINLTVVFMIYNILQKERERNLIRDIINGAKHARLKLKFRQTNKQSIFVSLLYIINCFSCVCVAPLFLYF